MGSHPWTGQWQERAKMKRYKLTQMLQIPKGKRDQKEKEEKRKKNKKQRLLPFGRDMNQVTRVAGCSVTRLNTRAPARSYW